MTITNHELTSAVDTCLRLALDQASLSLSVARVDDPEGPPTLRRYQKLVAAGGGGGYQWVSHAPARGPHTMCISEHSLDLSFIKKGA